MDNVFGTKNKTFGFLPAVIKGAIFSLSISIISICVFAFVLRFCNISINLIQPINQVIKIGSILLGTFLSLKKLNEMGLITGFIVGLLYTCLSFVIFSILNGSFNFNSTLINDCLFGGISGAIAGIIAVNLKKR